MNRSGAMIAATALLCLASEAGAGITWNPATGRAVIVSGPLELIVETKAGINARSLRDRTSGNVYADGDYAWPAGSFPRLEKEPLIRGRLIAFQGRLGDLQITQAFSIPEGESGVIQERITIRNVSGRAMGTADFKCGFAKPLRRGERWSEDAASVQFCPIPYRRETDGRIQEFPLADVARRGATFSGWSEEPVMTPAWGAEGWVWSRGRSSLLLAKFNPDSMEWSLMEPLRRGDDVWLRFGGAGQWKHGHPEGSTLLAAGGSYAFGETRMQAIAGDWKPAYYAFRRWLESQGCRTPKAYDPPVHWNELYDNEYYFKTCKACEQNLKPDRSGIAASYWPIDRKLLADFYSRDLMLAEAAKAKDLGCQALYMDPGWDTSANQQIWDAGRLGPLKDWIEKMRVEFGLKVSLWCSLGHVPPTYGDPEACPPQARVRDEKGRLTELVCFASPAYLATKEKRLIDLADAGVSFLMFDSTSFSGPCWDASHGHQVPSTREDHAQALLELIRRVKARHPEILIELHDPISGPSGIHYTPAYFGYPRPSSFDCLWGHEFMWNPLDDLLSRRALSLYYFNLAYDIPLYLHVNLKNDNEQALVFWWYASVCRHLGLGGKPPAPVWEAEKRAMKTYLSLKSFYSRGVFYGLEETVIAHTLPDEREAVINVFNLDDAPLRKGLRFRLAEIGLDGGRVRIEGAPFRQEGEAVAVDVEVPARGHVLLRVRRG